MNSLNFKKIFKHLLQKGAFAGADLYPYLNLWLTNKTENRRFRIVHFPNDLKIDLLIFDLLSKLPNEPKNKFYNSVLYVDWDTNYKSAPVEDVTFVKHCHVMQ